MPVAGSSHQFDGEDDDQHDAEPVVRQADADHRGAGDDAVDRAAGKAAGDGAHRVADDERDRHRKAGQQKVLDSAPVTSRITGRRVEIDTPKSPVSTWPSQIRYCTGSGRSKP